MSIITVNIKPFVLNQEIIVYTDGEYSETVKTPMAKLTSKIKELNTRYAIERIYFNGPKNYIFKYVTKIEEEIPETERKFTLHII